MTIHEIKYRVTNAPCFFDRATLRFFKQTLRDFSVRKYGRGFILTAPMRNGGRIVGETVRYFNPETNKFVQPETL